jgi:Core-2/I-Branching enzyme
MQIAYIISAYRNPAQLVRLVRRLSGPASRFYIHIDRKSSPEVALEARSGLAHRGDVRFLEPHDCHYLGFGHVEASLKGIRGILADGAHANYAILLTGQDYPIKSNGFIADFLTRANGQSFMNYVAMSDPIVAQGWPDAPERFRHWHIQGKRHAYYLPFNHEVQLLPFFSVTNGPLGFLLKHLLPHRKPPAGFPAFGGLGYWNLSIDCLKYIDEFVRSHPAFVRYFRYMRIPDEHFFQTILLNSPLKDRITNDSLRFVDWTGHTGPSPRTLGVGDIGKLRDSPALFARKFDSGTDPDVLDRLDEAFA